MWYLGSVDTVYVATCTTAYVVPSPYTVTSQEAKSGSAFSFSGSADGPVWINRAGTKMWWFAADTSPVIDQYVRTSTMSTPWDLDTLAAYTSQCSDGQWGMGGFNVSQGVIINEDATECLFLGASGADSAKFTLDVGNVVTNGEWTRGTIDSTTYDDFIGTIDADMGFMDSRGKLWRWDTGTINPYIGLWS
jgi:hypothetical protein